MPAPRSTHVAALAVVGVVAGAPGVARADPAPFVLPRLDVAREASLAVDYLGATSAPGEVHGVTVLLAARRPVARHVVVLGEVGVQWAERGLGHGTSLANATAGAIWAARVDGRDVTAVRVAVSLPVAATEGDAGVPSDVLGRYRPADGERFRGDTTTALLALSHRLERTKAFVQAEVGLAAQVRLDQGDDLLLRGGLAAGVRVVPWIAIVSELSMVSGVVTGGLPEVETGGAREDFRETLDLGLRIDAPYDVATGVRLQVPLDRSLRDQDVYVAGVDAMIRF